MYVVAANCIFSVLIKGCKGFLHMQHFCCLLGRTNIVSGWDRFAKGLQGKIKLLSNRIFLRKTISMLQIFKEDTKGSIPPNPVTSKRQKTGAVEVISQTANT
jgi:hypothetical protein